MALLDQRIKVDAEKHLALIFERLKEEPHDWAGGDLVVEGLAAQVDKFWVHLDVISGNNISP